MNLLYTDLQWLPAAPPDFLTSLKTLTNSSSTLGSDLQRLASHGLDLNQLAKLASVFQKVCALGKPLQPLTPFRLALLSNSTIDLIVPALVASALRHGIALEVIKPHYDQVAQEVLTPDSSINRSKPDAVLFALDYRALPLNLSFGNADDAKLNVEGAFTYLQTLRDAIKTNCGALCIFQTFAPPAETLFGSLDRALPGTIKNLIDQINCKLAEYVVGSGDVLFDVAGLAETVGLAEWHDPKYWNMAKLAFSAELIPLYSDHIARIVAAVRGKSRKVLVLDLDNTVWGGVIGDDGMEGIKIAQGDAIGEAHLQLQRLALDLRHRGVLLAVSSKNNEEIARAPFDTHPEMLLKLEHIAVFQANWNDKATNIQAIADELSLGLDALVFLDDNPVERGLVRKLLPQVAVPELPDDPAYYTRTLAAAGYFESVAFVAEDLQRSSFYQNNARRVNLQKQVGGVDAYLASLAMTITFQPFNAAGRARIVQLINKSNQYNLTTRRYTDPEVIAAEDDPDVFTLQVRLADIFGDNGMISVVVCRPFEAATWEIDTWLMSCRVLGRKVEHMVLREIVKHAHDAGIRKLIGVYKPTGRNKLVVDHYAKLGFTKLCEEDAGLTRWEFLVEDVDLESVPMNVISHGFVASKEGSLA